MWFKVVFNSDFSVSSCEPVSAVREGTKWVAYVEAETPASAISAGLSRFDREIREIKENQKRLAALRAERHASKEAEAEKIAQFRRQLDERLDHIPRRADPKIAAARVKELAACLNAFDSMTPRNFREWLAARYEKAKRKSRR